MVGEANGGVGNGGAKQASSAGGPAQVAKERKGTLVRKEIEKRLGETEGDVGKVVTSALKRGVVEPLTGALDEMEERVERGEEARKQGVATLKGDLTDLGKKVTNTDEGLTQLRSDVGDALTGVDKRVTDVENDLTKKLGETDTSLREDMGKGDKRVEDAVIEVRKTVDGVDERLKKVETVPVSNEDGNVEQVPIADAVAALRDKFGSFLSALGGTNESVGDLRTEVDEVKGKVTTLERDSATRKDVVGLVGGLKDDITRVDGRIDAVEGAVKAVKDAIDGTITEARRITGEKDITLAGAIVAIAAKVISDVLGAAQQVPAGPTNEPGTPAAGV